MPSGWLNWPECGANKMLCEQFDLAMIWMGDVNRARWDRKPYGMLARLSAREVAEHHLNAYFQMIEAALPQ